MKPINRLKALSLEYDRKKYPNFPEGARYVEKYSDRTANGLTKCILDWIKFHGGQAERISVTGRYIDNSKVVTDCIGRKRKIGSGKYIPSSMQKGSADLSATIQGRSVKIEIKIKYDKQSEAQREYQQSIERAGGTYIIVRNFNEFINWYDLNYPPF